MWPFKTRTPGLVLEAARRPCSAGPALNTTVDAEWTLYCSVTSMRLGPVILLTTCDQGAVNLTLHVANSRFGMQLELDARYLGGFCELESEETTNDGGWKYLAVMMAGRAL